MKMRDTIRRAGRSLRQAKARTLLTSLAIGVGAFTITLAFAAGEGGRDYASSIINSNTNPKEIYVQPKQDAANDPTKPKEYSTDPTVSFGGGFSLKLLKQSDIDKIADVQGVKQVTPVYTVSIEYITSKESKKYTASVQPFDKNVQLDYVAGGADLLDSGSVVIPDTFREVLGFSSPQAAIGEVVQVVVAKGDSSLIAPELKTYDFKIAGVIERSAVSVTAPNTLQLQNDTALELYSVSEKGTPLEGAYMGAAAEVNDLNEVNAVKERINQLGYDAQTAEDLMSFIFQFINVLQGILLGFGALAVLTSVFGIINTQYISVLERTQQIGLMKALGMRRRDVGRLFRYEAAWVGFLGGIIGSGVATATGLIANPYISQTLNLGDVSLFVFTPPMVGSVVIGLMVVSVTAGIFPARKAAKLDPIEALRTE